VYGVLSWREHERTVRPSFEIEMYLFFATLLSLARVRTLWMIQEEAEESIAIPAIFTASLAVQAVGILVESWEKHRMLREPYANWARETLGGTFNKSFFVWLCPILLRGSRQLLSLSDLPPLDPKLEAEKLETDFQEAWDSGTFLELCFDPPFPPPFSLPELTALT
jgi:ATP-binding cassette, subfamily C (CFTR/MRP), member 1